MKPYAQYKDSGVEWIGEIPAHWKISRVKFVSKLISKGTTPSTIGKNTSSSGNIKYLKAENISGGQIVIPPEFFIDGDTHKLLSRSQLHEHDILFVIAGATIGKTALLNSENLPANTNQAVSFIRPNFEAEPKYMHIWLQSTCIQDAIWVSSVQSAQPNLSMSELGNLPIPLPPKHEEQTAIATYLDRKTTQINTLIAKKQRLVELLREERTAIINHAVTKGLDATVPLKDSGVEWIGEVPRCWKIIKLKYLTTKIGSGVTPKGGSSVYASNGVPLIRSQNVHFGGLRVGNIAHIPEEIHKSMKSSKVLPNDVLLNITGASIGRCCIVPFKIREANVNQHVCIVRPNAKISSKYLNFFLASENGQAQIFSGEKGISREGLNFEELKSFTVTLPTRSEQQAIATYLDNNTAQIDALIVKTQKQIELLQEYRTALISSVVTGKVDVRQEVIR